MLRSSAAKTRLVFELYLGLPPFIRRFRHDNKTRRSWNGTGRDSRGYDRGREARAYILVHGAWHGGWCWAHTAERMRSAGVRVFTPTQTGLGERQHLISKDLTLDSFTQDIINVIEAEELSDVTLVGHSFGGQIVTLVADRIPQKLRRVVYLDGGWPDNGKSVFDGQPPELVAQRLKAAQDFSGGVSFPPPGPEAFGVTDATNVAWLKRRMTPHPIGTYSSKAVLKGPPGNGLPVTFIRCTEPAYALVDRYEKYAREQKSWQILTIRCGHDAMVLKPEETADLLVGLA